MALSNADPIDRELKSILQDLDRRLRARLGRNYLRLILFGSRGRGDHRPDSDVDVAVVIRGPIADRWGLKCRIIEETYPLLLETGLYVQPWPVSEPDLADGALPLLRNIRRDGIAI